MEEVDRLWESNKDLIITFCPETAKKLMMQEYNKTTKNVKNKQTSKEYWEKLS